MANLMGVTNPSPAHDSMSNNRPSQEPVKTNDTTVKNITDPSRVVRADARTDQSSSQDAQSAALRYNSNMQSFIEKLKNAPDLAKEISKAMTLMQSTVSTPGLSENVTSEMAAFLKMINMDEKAFRSFFKSQMSTQSRFSGPLFDMLRAMYNSSQSNTVKQGILNFLKRYGDFTQTGHIQKNMEGLLNQISDYLPSSWRDKLAEMTAKLQAGFNVSSRSDNLKLLQNDIIPYLASYIERTNDMGYARTLLSMLMLNIPRYENGSQEGMLMAFRQLGSYNQPLTELNRLDNTALLKLLTNSNYAKALGNDAFTAQFSHIAQQALSGAYGSDMKDVFSEIIRAILLNESVYMTVNHNILPMEYNGKMMYSEMWVDPDADGDKNGRGKNSNNERIQFLFKLDIQNLGFVEMTLSAQKNNVDMNIYGPQEVADLGEIIREDIRGIFSQHGINCNNLNVEKCETPIAITKVFPDLFKGGRNVNVKI